VVISYTTAHEKINGGPTPVWMNAYLNIFWTSITVYIITDFVIMLCIHYVNVSRHTYKICSVDVNSL